MLLFRGTQGRKPQQTARGAVSYTPSLLVATIYSAMPGDIWSSRRPQFLKESTVHAVLLRNPRIFDLRSVGSFASVSEILESIGYPENISEKEAIRIYNYMHNRITGKARGGDFLYKVFDEEWDEISESDIPFTLLRPESAISVIARDDFRSDPTLDMARRTVADTFIFVDVPSVQKAIRRMGYDVVAYIDVFGGGSFAARDLLRMDEEELHEQDGVWESTGIEGECVLVHESYRILNSKIVQQVESMPVAEAIDMLRAG